MRPDDRLDRWIHALPDRLERGELDGFLPFDCGDGTDVLPAEQATRVMLADLDDLDDPAGSWGGDAAWHDERLTSLHDDFRRRTSQEAGVVFAEHGLTGPFWEVP